MTRKKYYPVAVFLTENERKTFKTNAAIEGKTMARIIYDYLKRKGYFNENTSNTE